MDTKATIGTLFKAGAHYGLGPSRRHPGTAPYLFGTKGGTEIFNLEETAQCLESALAFVASLAAARKTILFVGSKAEARNAIVRVANRIGQPFVAGRFIGGSLTNFSEIKKRINRLSELTEMREKGELTKFTKHERLLIDREITDLETMFGGLKGMQKLPDALCIIDPKHEKGAVDEAHQLGIPTIALLNSDCDPSRITYPIPGNDASQETVRVVLEEIAKAYESNLGVTPAPAAETAGQ